jgi:transcriptional regulator with XRE-family HTH domain
MPADVRTAIAVLSTLGERVAATRGERELSYREAAAIIGISASTMYGIESGKRDPGVIVVLRVLRWLTEDGETWEPGRKATGRRSTLGKSSPSA